MKYIFDSAGQYYFISLVDEAVTLAQDAIFVNRGQVCCAGSHTFVQEGIYDEFVKRSAALATKVKVGNPFAPDTVQGPQIDKDSFSQILTYIDYGKKDGAKLEAGGKRIGTEGYFVEPTVFSNITDDMRVAKDDPLNALLNSRPWTKSLNVQIEQIMDWPQVF